MMNCHIAVEDYMRSYNQGANQCQFINLRLGLYSGKRLNMGLLPLLLTRSQLAKLPYIKGRHGHLPIVDGKDIGQAFARAALAPCEANFSSLNICGPETPSQADVMRFIEQQAQIKPLNWGLPSPLASPLIWLAGTSRRADAQPLFTRAMLDMLKSPLIDNQLAQLRLGYDPEISWQASLLNTLELHKNQSLNKDISQPNRALDLG